MSVKSVNSYYATNCLFLSILYKNCYKSVNPYMAHINTFKLKQYTAGCFHAHTHTHMRRRKHLPAARANCYPPLHPGTAGQLLFYLLIFLLFNLILHLRVIEGMNFLVNLYLMIFYYLVSFCSVEFDE